MGNAIRGDHDTRVLKGFALGVLKGLAHAHRTGADPLVSAATFGLADACGQSPHRLVQRANRVDDLEQIAAAVSNATVPQSAAPVAVTPTGSWLLDRHRHTLGR